MNNYLSGLAAITSVAACTTTTIGSGGTGARLGGGGGSQYIGSGGQYVGPGEYFNGTRFVSMNDETFFVSTGGGEDFLRGNKKLLLTKRSQK